MLLIVKDENGHKTYSNTSIANNNELCRFFPEMLIPDDGDASKGTLAITWRPVDGSKEQTLDIPLEPDASTLESIDVLMHLSPTKAWKMEQQYNDWLSSCLGYDVVLAYIGENRRQVRMSSSGQLVASSNVAGGWLSSMASKASGLIGGAAKEPEITFSDVAPYLVVSSRSMDDVHTRLPEGEEFDITKFRPNVIVSGAQDPWEEDYWAEIKIGEEKATIKTDHNCGRCRSINVDYNTGAQGTGEAGKMLKMLSKDRRVDQGTKWSPIFGRYSFLHPDSEGNVIKLEDDVEVSKRNTEHTAFGKCLT